MNRRSAMLALIFAIVLVPAGAASTGLTAKAPAQLVLQKSDFPARTMHATINRDLSGFEPRLQAGGIEYEATTATALGHSSTNGTLNVTATVFVTTSVAQAKKAFKLLRPPGREPFWIAGGIPLTVAAYGDEQVGRLKAAGGEGIWFARIVVRKSGTLWTLHVTSERRPALARSEVLAAFEALARKQKRRVGTG